MKTRVKNGLGVVLITLITLSSPSFAEGEKVGVTSDTLKLINIAGNQRMLSQRIAKDYLYEGKQIAKVKAHKQLEESLTDLSKSHQLLVDSINNNEIKNLLDFVKMSTEDLEGTIKEPFSLDNAQLIIDLSESMLEGSEYVVHSLKETIASDNSQIVALAEKQRMLAQRIAKYYIAYQSGIKDINTIEQMNLTVKSFSDAHKILLENKQNTPEINRKLNQVDRLWKIVYKFYLNIEKGGLPLIVYNSSDDITTKMDKVTELYIELYK